MAGLRKEAKLPWEATLPPPIRRLLSCPGGIFDSSLNKARQMNLAYLGFFIRRPNPWCKTHAN